MVYIHVSGLYEQPQCCGEIALLRPTAEICEMLNKLNPVTDTNQMMKTSLVGTTGRLKGAVTSRSCSQVYSSIRIGLELNEDPKAVQEN